MSRLSKPAIALASLLAAAGCAGNKAKPVIESPKQVVYASLPARSVSEQKVVDDLASKYSLVYTQSNSLLSHNLSATNSSDSISDLTLPIKEKYGSVVDEPTLSGSNYVFFKRNGNIYAFSLANNQNKELHLMALNVNPNEYQITGEDIIFTSSNATSNSIKRIKKNGSLLEELTNSTFDSLSELRTSSSGKRAVYAKIPRKRVGPGSIFKTKEYVVLDLSEKAPLWPRRIGFEEEFGSYGTNEGPGNVSFIDDNTVLFTYRFPNRKENNLMFAELLPLDAGCYCLPINKETIKKITADDEDIIFASAAEDGFLYVSDKSGSPRVYFNKDGIASPLLLSDFNGRMPLLAKK